MLERVRSQIWELMSIVKASSGSPLEIVHSVDEHAAGSNGASDAVTHSATQSILMQRVTFISTKYYKRNIGKNVDVEATS